MTTAPFADARTAADAHARGWTAEHITTVLGRVGGSEPITLSDLDMVALAERNTKQAALEHADPDTSETPPPTQRLSDEELANAAAAAARLTGSGV